MTTSTAARARIYLSPEIRGAAEQAADKAGETLAAFVNRTLKNHLRQKGFLEAETIAAVAGRNTIAVSAQVAPEMRAALYALARSRRQSVSDLLRPAIAAVVASTQVPADTFYEPAGGSTPCAVRVPFEMREALQRLATERGTVVSRILRALISDVVSGKGDIAR